MAFKRRTPRRWHTTMIETVYPRGGWSRAVSAMLHRLRRLPDPPARIARGVAAGVFISFTPLFGIHVFGAVLLAWLIRGNIVAALIGTLVGNPLTFPIFAYVSVHLGHFLIGSDTNLGMDAIFQMFRAASVEFWANIRAIFTDDTARWGDLSSFVVDLFLPDLIGSIPIGLAAGFLTHRLTLPLVTAYKARRTRRLRDRKGALRDGRRPADSPAAETPDPAAATGGGRQAPLD